MDSLRNDMAYALRSFRSNPGFTAAATLLLAIWIGANTATFSVTTRCFSGRSRTRIRNA